jgi:hypothetical protein
LCVLGCMLIFQLGAPFYETACVGLCQHAVKLERMRVPRVPKQATLSSTSSPAACAGSYHAHARAARAQASWRRWRRCWAASWTTSACAAWSRPAARPRWTWSPRCARAAAGPPCASTAAPSPAGARRSWTASTCTIAARRDWPQNSVIVLGMTGAEPCHCHMPLRGLAQSFLCVSATRLLWVGTTKAVPMLPVPLSSVCVVRGGMHASS